MSFQLFLPQIMEMCINTNIYLTQFEIIFLLACLKFKSANCDAIVLEVTYLSLQSFIHSFSIYVH